VFGNIVFGHNGNLMVRKRRSHLAFITADG